MRLSPTVLSLAALAALAACTEHDVTSMENGLWQMFAGHDKPIILEAPPPPVYCARTIGEPDCYAEPIEAGREAAIR